MSEGASRSASGTPTGTGSGTPSGTPTPSRTPTPSLTRGASPSGTGTPTPTPTPSPSMPANSTANCTLTPWGAWSSCEDACAALPYGGAVSRRSRTVAEPAGPLGHCPPAAELTEERACGVCATPSSSPLPSPPATCWNGVRDGDETDVDCGGGAGCPRCDAGQACGDTRDCVQPLLADLVVTAPAAPAGGGDSAGWGWSALGAYAGPAFVCAADAALDSDAGAAASPVCIDVRLSRAVYEAAAGAAVNSSNVTGGNATGNATGNGTSAGGVGVVLPTFLQLRVRVAGLPASARRGAVAVAVRAAIVRAASDAGIDLLNGDVVIASLAAPLPAPPGSPATGSSHGTANVTQHGNGTLAGNGTASNGTTGCVQPVNASSENATGTCNGTNTTASPTVSAGGNATNATVGNAPSGGNATGIVNATSGRRAADAASTLRARPALGVQLRSRRLAGAPATSSGAQSLDVAVRVLVPRGADNATLADGLNAGAGAQLAAALASELVAALNLTAAQAGNLTLTLVQRAAVVDALPALLAVTRSPVVAPVPAGEGAGSGGAAAAAVVLSLLALVVLGGAGVVRAHGVLRLPGLDPHSEAGLAATRALLPIATLCGAAPLGDHARWRLDERLADAHGGKPMSRVVTASAGQARASRSRAKAWLPGVSAAQAWPAASAAQVPVVHSPLAVVEAINRAGAAAAAAARSADVAIVAPHAGGGATAGTALAPLRASMQPMPVRAVGYGHGLAAGSARTLSALPPPPLPVPQNPVVAAPPPAWLQSPGALPPVPQHAPPARQQPQWEHDGQAAPPPQVSHGLDGEHDRKHKKERKHRHRHRRHSSALPAGHGGTEADADADADGAHGLDSSSQAFSTTAGGALDAAGALPPPPAAPAAGWPQPLPAATAGPAPLAVPTGADTDSSAVCHGAVVVNPLAAGARAAAVPPPPAAAAVPPSHGSSGLGLVASYFNPLAIASRAPAPAPVTAGLVTRFSAAQTLQLARRREGAAVCIQRRYKGWAVRRAVAGWTRESDDTDVWFVNARTGATEWLLPRMPFQPAGEGAEEGDAHRVFEFARVEAPAAASPVEDSKAQAAAPVEAAADDSRALAPGWVRCEDGGGDVWYFHAGLGESCWEPVYT